MPKRKGALRPSAVQSLRTRHDLEYLRRDGSLSRLVVSDAQVPKDLTTVVGRLVHRGHPRPVLRRVAVKERFVQLHARRCLRLIRNLPIRLSSFHISHKKYEYQS